MGSHRTRGRAENSNQYWKATMGDKDNMDKARQLFREAYHRQSEGELDAAVRLYRESIHCHPTA